MRVQAGDSLPIQQIAAPSSQIPAHAQAQLQQAISTFVSYSLPMSKTLTYDMVPLYFRLTLVSLSRSEVLSCRSVSVRV